jgi:hypothetical protein
MRNKEILVVYKLYSKQMAVIAEPDSQSHGQNEAMSLQSGFESTWNFKQ